MAGDRRIPIPYAQRWRRFRYQLLPFLTVLLGVFLVRSLWREQGRMANAVGEVESVRIDVATRADGLLVPLEQSPPWTLFADVKPNQVIARLDDRPLRASLATLQLELVKLQKEIAATETEFVRDQAAQEFESRQEAFRLAWQVEQLRLDVLDRDALVAADEVELKRLEARVEYLEPLRTKGNITELEFVNEQLLRDQTSERIKKNRAAREEAIAQGKRASQRLQQLPPVAQAAVDKLLAPLRADLQTQEARIRELNLQLESLEVRSPIEGTITVIHTWPGQSVRAGDPIVTLAARHGGYIVSYVRDDQRVRPRVEMQVALRTRLNPRVQHQAKVVEIGPQVEEVPPHQLRGPATPEWGLPVKISIPPDLGARPGELIDVTFERDEGGNRT